MNASAQKHLTKAKGYVAKGEEFYRKAAEEIVAAQKADPTLSNREIGEWFGHGKDWVARIVRWSTTDDAAAPTPFTGKEESGAQEKRAAKKVLREATVEDLGKLIYELPTETRQKLAKAVEATHPATAPRMPTPISEVGAGFLIELGGPSVSLKKAINTFVDLWDKLSDKATDEEKSIVLDDIAPELFRLQMISTREEVYE